MLLRSCYIINGLNHSFKPQCGLNLLKKYAHHLSSAKHRVLVEYSWTEVARLLIAWALERIVQRIIYLASDLHRWVNIIGIAA